jgi:hypothetical protein
MVRRYTGIIIIIMILLASGCVKDTYDMNMLSKKASLTPTMVISAMKGNVSLSDIVKSSDTVVYGQDNFVKIVYKKDSVINLRMADFYDLGNMVSFSQKYTIGELSLSSFQSTLGVSLDQISQNFSAPLRNQFLLLNDGAAHPFPAFPSTNLGERTFTGITNFQNAVFASGFLDISVTNNLPAPLNSISVNLYNTAGHAPIGTTLTIPAVSQGQTQSASIDLTGKTLTNSIIAAVVLSGSPGNSTPVVINLASNNIQVKIQGRNLKVKSGRVILPAQLIPSLDNKDTISFDPGLGIEIEKLKILTGNVTYHIRSTSTLTAALNITIPTALRSGTAISELINVGPVTQFDGTISFANTDVDLSSDPGQKFNRVPFNYSINVNSNNSLIDFNSTDLVQFDMKLLNPDFDYVKGYFGQQTESINADTLDLGLKDILSNMSGSFLISNPSIRLNYSNSFGIPIEVDFKAAGKRGLSTVNLDLLPFIISYPLYPASRDAASFLDINKNNSKLPQLISMPPEEIKFSGSAKMNPAGDPTHLRNNYVFGNSRFLGSLEVELPMEFRINNIQFTDTADNFLQSDINSDSPIKPENFKLLRMDINAKNGFPLGISLKLSLYDSFTHSIKKSVDATDLLKPAPVDANGKSSGISETSTSIEFTKEFFSSVADADKIIFHFTLNTTDNGSKDVKIYSDYRIDFKAALVVKPDIELK